MSRLPFTRDTIPVVPWGPSATAAEVAASAENDAPPLGDRTRWFMAQAWEEGVRAGHECVGAEVKPSCMESNPYRVTPPGRGDQ